MAAGGTPSRSPFLASAIEDSRSLFFRLSRSVYLCLSAQQCNNEHKQETRGYCAIHCLYWHQHRYEMKQRTFVEKRHASQQHISCVLKLKPLNPSSPATRPLTNAPKGCPPRAKIPKIGVFLLPSPNATDSKDAGREGQSPSPTLLNSPTSGSRRLHRVHGTARGGESICIGLDVGDGPVGAREEALGGRQDTKHQGQEEAGPHLAGTV